MSSNDHGITVTIKYGKAYDDTWVVFKGASAGTVRADIIAYFGLDYEATRELTLHELAVNATQVAHGVSTAVRVLEAVAVPKVSVDPTPTHNPWANLPDEFTPEALREEKAVKEEKPFAHVYELFAQATDRTALQRVWATNQDAFGDEDVVAAYKARGKELA